MAEAEKEPKTIGKSEADPRYKITVSITRGTKSHRGWKDPSGALINNTMEFSSTVTLQADTGTISQSELYNEAASYLDDIYFDQMEASGQIQKAITEG
jgi:hypothetical protein